MSSEPLIGRKLAHYRIERFIGQGGMAQVYYAEDESLGRPVAVKVINADLRGNAAYAERFVQEARAIAQWRHHNVLQVHYAGEEDGLYFFAMEYISGFNLEQILSQYIQRGELIPHDDILRVGQAVANALDYAHSKHVIHRDVKPSNILIDEEERIVLADFGLAMDVQRGSMGETFGTPHYIAPEQAMNSADAVPQSDLYSLGIILYEMLTGVVPFDEPSSMSVALKHLTTPPPPPRTINPNLSEGVESVLLKALEKEPEKRYANGAALMAAVTKAVQAQKESSQDFLALPPLPVSTEMPQLSLSRLSVVDSMRLSVPSSSQSQVDAPTIPKASASPTPSHSTAPVAATHSLTVSGRSVSKWLGMGGVAFLIFLILATGLFLLLPNEGGEASATATVASLVEAEITNTVPAPTETEAIIVSDETETVETAEAITTNIAPTVITEIVTVETAVATIPPTPTTAAPSPTAIVPSSTPVATAVPPTPALPAIEPTIAYPDGRRLELVYDANSFYLYNPEDERVRVSDITFQSLDGSGRPLRYGMGADRWTQFYSFVDGYSCYRIEPFGVSGAYMRPAYCRDYNSSVTPTEDGEELFWLAWPNAVEFRVLWAGEEIARCPLGENSCTIFVPTT